MSVPSRAFLRSLLESEDGQNRIRKLWEAATEKEEKVVGWSTCSNCHHRNETLVEAYSLKDAIAILNFAASYGVGKPPEEKRVDINVTATRINELSDEELDAIIDGRAALPAG